MWGPRIHGLGTVNKKNPSASSGKKKKIFIQAVEDENPLRKSLKLSELFCLLEVKAQLYKVLR